MRQFRQPFRPSSLGGRPKKLTEAQLAEMARRLDAGEPVAKVAKAFGVATGTVYRKFPAAPRYEAAAAAAATAARTNSAKARKG
jgi:transposase